MTRLLIRLFIKDSENINNRIVRRAYGTMAGIVGIVCNVFLCISKLITGILTGAISITADAVNNLTDAASSIITLVGFKMAGKSADREHPYGHGRIEYITGLLISLVIMLVGVELFRSSLESAISPQETEFRLISVIVLVLSILVKLWMSLFNKKLSKKLNSSALHATSIDSLSDCIATSAVIIGILIGMFTGINLDPYIGMLVACFVVVAGFKSAAESLNPLIGEAPDSEFVAEIEKTVLADKRVLGLHDVLVHSYGATHIVASLHAELPANIDLMTAHSIIDEIEDKIHTKFGCEITIHADPIEVDKKVTTPIYTDVLNAVRNTDRLISIKRFRVTKGYARTYVLFDLAFPDEIDPISYQHAKESVIKALKTLYPDIEFIVRTTKKAAIPLGEDENY